MKILVIGNCQCKQTSMGLTYALNGLAQVAYQFYDYTLQTDLDALTKCLDGTDVIVTNSSTTRFEMVFPKQKIISIPDLQFGGFHPDQTSAQCGGWRDDYHMLYFLGVSPVSALALWAFTRGRSARDTVSLFTDNVFEALGYFDYFSVCLDALALRFEAVGLDFAPVLDQMRGSTVAMWGSWHPKMPVCLGLVDSLLKKFGITPAVEPMSLIHLLPDQLQQPYAWGCYPPIASYLGVEGSWAFRHGPNIVMSVQDHINLFFNFLSQYPRDQLQVVYRDQTTFDLTKFDAIIGGLP